MHLERSELNTMVEGILIFGNKLEASALVTAIGSGEGSDCFHWEGECLEFRAVTGLLVSNSSCFSSSAIDSFLMFRNLSSLTLSFNGITGLQSLSPLERLQHLDVSHNKLTDVEAVRDMKELRCFRCNNNKISSIEPLRNVTTLSELWICNNSIVWESVIHLQPNTNLKRIVMYNNPLESKPKVEEFLKAVCASLETINGVNCVGGAGDFLSTADGRVMATQARAQLTARQREDDAGLAAKRKNSSKALLKTGSLSSMIQSRSDEDCVEIRVTASAGGPHNAVGDPASPSKGEPGSRVYKAQKIKMSHGMGQKFDQGTRNSVSAASRKLPALDNHITFDELGSDKAVVIERCGHPVDEPKDAVAIGASVTGASVTVYFSNSNTSPIAVCLFPDGSGYTRWNRAGTVACSFDIGGRLFSSHKSGALAAIVAPDGSGSVMDEHGNSVLTLKSTGEALLYNTAGEIEYNFERRNLNEQKVNAKTETLVIYNGSARKKVQKINLCDFCQHNRDAIYEFTLQWVFLDLIVEFSPATWEVTVMTSNGKADCKFSSLSGGVILSGAHAASKKNKMNSPIKKSQTKRTECLMSDAEHDDLRTGIQSIMAQMDEMLSDLKKQPKKA